MTSRVYTPVEHVLRSLRITPKKSLGQHFLTSPFLLEDISTANHSLSLRGKSVLEIGPGPGGLTQHILAQEPRSLTLVEKDERFLPFLHSIVPAAHVLAADVLTCDAITQRHQFDVVMGNLPYNVSAPILVRLCQYQPALEHVVVMVQREVAQRMVEPQSGRLGTMLSLYFEQIESVLDVAPEDFSPPPAVWSSVVKMVPRKDPAEMTLGSVLDRVRMREFGAVERAVMQLYQHKRKMLANVMQRWNSDDDRKMCPVDVGRRRAEELSWEEIVAMVDWLSSSSSSSSASPVSQSSSNIS
jgi:16S rRNA (adenine1518-N6/adenine1519-N6)-dimethyltransferase